MGLPVLPALTAVAKPVLAACRIECYQSGCRKAGVVLHALEEHLGPVKRDKTEGMGYGFGEGRMDSGNRTVTGERDRIGPGKIFKITLIH